MKNNLPPPSKTLAEALRDLEAFRMASQKEYGGRISIALYIYAGIVFSALIFYAIYICQIIHMFNNFLKLLTP